MHYNLETFTNIYQWLSLVMYIALVFGTYPILWGVPKKAQSFLKIFESSSVPKFYFFPKKELRFMFGSVTTLNTSVEEPASENPKLPCALMPTRLVWLLQGELLHTSSPSSWSSLPTPTSLSLIPLASLILWPGLLYLSSHIFPLSSRSWGRLCFCRVTLRDFSQQPYQQFPKVQC